MTRLGAALIAMVLVLAMAPTATAKTPAMQKMALPSDMHAPVVSCWSGTDCLGFAQWGQGGASRLMRLHGATASVAVEDESPAPTGIGAISCVSATWCMGTGSPGLGVESIAASWDGTRWTDVALARVRGAQLAAIDCVSTIFCMAAGFSTPGYGNGLSTGDLIEQWNGKSWKKLTTPWPAPKHDGPVGTSLEDVSCVDASFCIAVGTQFGGGIIERWNGKSWKNVSVPGLGDVMGLDHVECLSKKWCLAFGSDMDNLTTYRWNGTTWSKTGKKALGALIKKRVMTPVALSCATTKDCYAVTSNYNLKTSQDRYLLFHWNGKKWASVAAPQGKKNRLADVVCLSAGRCLAVGFKGTRRTTGKAIVAATFPVTVTAG